MPTKPPKEFVVSEEVRPERCRIRIEEEDRDLVLTYRHPYTEASLFFFLFLIVWSVGCFSVVGMAIFQPAVDTVLFAVPFATSWIFMVTMMVRSFIGWDWVRLGLDGLAFYQQHGPMIWHRRVPIHELKAFRSGKTVVRTEDGTTHSTWVHLETLGGPLQLFSEITEQEQGWVIAVLQSWLAAVRPDALSADEQKTTNAEGAWPLAPTDVVAAPPSDVADLGNSAIQNMGSDGRRCSPAQRQPGLPGAPTGPSHFFLERAMALGQCRRSDVHLSVLEWPRGGLSLVVGQPVRPDLVPVSNTA
jgi:hypothetical protein